MKAILLILLTLTFSSPAFAQNMEQHLDHYLDTELKKLNIPDVEVLVVDKNTIRYHRSIGEKAASNKRFYLGSVSKSLTAFAVLQLVEKKELGLDDQVKAILPEIEFLEYGEQLSVRNLLNHTSGIQKQEGFNPLPGLDQLKTKKVSLKLHTPPGEKHEYSNLNYALLGLIIERISNQSFGAFMAESVFGPLEMKEALIGSREDLRPQLVDQYQYLGPFPIKSKQLNFSTSSIPAGFICASAQDMGHYLQANLNQGSFQGQSILSSELLNTMHSTWHGGDYGYAMGWKQGNYNGEVFYQHLGSTATSYAGIFLIPGKDLAFVLLTNTNSLSFGEDLAEGILHSLTSGAAPPSLSRLEFFMRIGILLGVLLITWFFIRQLKSTGKEKKAIPRQTKIVHVLYRIFIIVGVYLTFPRIADIPLLAFSRIQPDIGMLLVVSLIFPLIAAIWALLKSEAKAA